MNAQTPKLEGRCHCGAVTFTLASPPSWTGSCNCSICRKLGSRFAYYPPDRVALDAAPEATVAYVWGDRTIALHHCRVCGCTTHWRSLLPDPEKMGVNARLIEGFDLESVPCREIDGASY